MIYKIVQFKDLKKSWSAIDVINITNGKKAYLEKDGKYVETDKRRSFFNITWLFPEQVEEINKILLIQQELKNKLKQLLKQKHFIINNE